MALRRLGYSAVQVKEIIDFIDEHETIEGAPHVKPSHAAVFDCAFKPLKGQRSIHYMGHIKMMGAVQPFISGAISKTVNVPKEATAEEISTAYLESWRLGAKAVSIYRDGSKRTQPLNTSRDTKATPAQIAEAAIAATPQPIRRRLPDERRAITHKFDIAGHEGYITAGCFEDGTPGEIFLVMAKEGSTISGFADAFAQAISYALQYGVPLQVLVDKFSHARFEPSGMTKNPEIRFAKSIVDYVFRWMATKFLSEDAKFHAGVNGVPEPVEPVTPSLFDTPAGIVPNGNGAAANGHGASAHGIGANGAGVYAAGANGAANAVGANGAGASGLRASVPSASSFAAMRNQEDAPPCSTCGSIMVRSGACYKCANCGTTSGCA
jgi:ribonucleoside-diphosphate reductase alpha chain